MGQFTWGKLLALLLVLIQACTAANSEGDEGSWAAKQSVLWTANLHFGAADSAFTPKSPQHEAMPSAIGENDPQKPVLSPRARADLLARYGWLDDSGPSGRELLVERFPPPARYRRVQLEPSSFAEYLRYLPLLPPGSDVHSHRGVTLVSSDDTRIAAVIDLDVGKQDLQQCADTVIRLHAEWAFWRGDQPIFYRAGDGTRLAFDAFLQGKRWFAEGPRLTTHASAAPRVRDHSALRNYADNVFQWVNTRALAHFAQSVAPSALAPGDFFVMTGTPYGHAVLVLDVAQNPEGQVRLLLGQGYMPAQEMHVLRHRIDGPWFALEHNQKQLKTPFWRPFPLSTARRFAPRTAETIAKPPR